MCNIPKFFIIGAAKSGTSTIFNYLKRHKQIYIPDIKETEYYSNEKYYKKGIKWYKSLYEKANKNQICGDASTTYSRWPHTKDVAKRIHDDIPEAKIIYIMRHPVERAYSHYRHHMRSGITMKFEEALNKDNIYVDCSKYIVQIEKYLQYFDRKKILCLFYDKLKNDPESVINKIINFLQIKEIDLLKDGLIYKNVGTKDYYIRSQTTDKLKKIPIVKIVANRLPQRWKDIFYKIIKKSIVGRKLESKYNIPKISDVTYNKLLEYFNEYNIKLEKLLKINLIKWNEKESN